MFAKFFNRKTVVEHMLPFTNRILFFSCFFHEQNHFLWRKKRPKDSLHPIKFIPETDMLRNVEIHKVSTSIWGGVHILLNKPS